MGMEPLTGSNATMISSPTPFITFFSFEAELLETNVYVPHGVLLLLVVLLLLCLNMIKDMDPTGIMYGPLELI
jgi:hypothetical protein